MADTPQIICEKIETPEAESHALSRAEILKCTKASLVAFLLSATGAVSAQQEGDTQRVSMLTTHVSYTDTRPQQTAILTTTPASPAVSADAASANGYGQVEFQGEKISVAEVQAKIGAMGPEERTKAIKEGMNRSDRLIFKTWEQQLANNEVEQIKEDAKVAINNNQTKLEAEKTKDQNIQTLDLEVKKMNQEFIRKVKIYVSGIENNESLLKNKDVVKYLQELYDDRRTMATDESLFGRIQALMGKLEKYHVQANR